MLDTLRYCLSFNKRLLSAQCVPFDAWAMHITHPYNINLKHHHGNLTRRS